VLRHELTCRARQKRLRRTVEVTKRDTAVFEGKRWEERLDETVLSDQSLRNDPKNLCPDLTNRVDSPVPRLVECLVRGRINGIVLRRSKSDAARLHEQVAYKRVRVFPNAFICVGSPSAHRIIRVKCLAANGGSKEVCETKVSASIFRAHGLIHLPNPHPFRHFRPIQDSQTSRGHQSSGC
jgi:hypothetical protein